MGLDRDAYRTLGDLILGDFVQSESPKNVDRPSEQHDHGREREHRLDEHQQLRAGRNRQRVSGTKRSRGDEGDEYVVHESGRPNLGE